ncbi:uncharacterized protein LOC124316402 [Daphnia pulicaria]|uniref:uncharacterized protein LOC124316402 n=1 Tax=Daphnia pulicaria TaxID=35523 RepID=UPI001EE9E388|nr:uncharacterized protein LOC124316402 [Daphnia pulicaria]
MAEFYCAHCKIQMNSTSQWDAHVIGGKHMRAVTMNQPLAVDMSAAIVLPNGNFKCKSCDDFECSGHIPFEQHLTGKKHLKNVQRGKESTQFNTAVKSPLYGQRQPTTLVHSPPAMKSGSLPIALADVSSALLQPDGSYKCKVCVDFTCSGPIPMQDHLNGKSHLKNLKTFPGRKFTFEQMNISAPTPKVNYRQSSLTVDERIEKAWNHQTICGYNYDEFFSNLSIEKKIEDLNPHFAFIGKDDPMPNFVKYLSM